MTLKNILQLAIFLVCSHSFSQLGIGTSLPNESAQLDVVSSDKGILIPRIALTSLTDASTIANGNIESLMVYNTGNTAGLTPGYYYWADATWHRLALQEEIIALPRDVTSTNGSITGTVADAALVAMDLEVKVDDTTLEVDATKGLQIKNDGITTVKILDDNVTVSKLGAAAGDANKILGSDTAGNVEWQDAATLATSLGENVTSTNGSITGTADDAALVTMNLEVKVDDTTLEVDATNGVQVKDDGITTVKIANNAVDGTKIQVTGEAEGSMLYNNGTDWVDFPKGTARQVLTMNAAGTAPEWTAPVSAKRIGEFVYAKSGRDVADGYLAVTPGTITNGAVDYPLWAAEYPEFVSGSDIVFPADVAGMFLRNMGGNAATEGNLQTNATALPNSPFSTNTTGNHSHYFQGDNSQGEQVQGGSGAIVQGAENSSTGRYTSPQGSHSHSIVSGGDAETRPVNRAYQLYTLVDTY